MTNLKRRAGLALGVGAAAVALIAQPAAAASCFVSVPSGSQTNIIVRNNDGQKTLKPGTSGVNFFATNRAAWFPTGCDMSIRRDGQTVYYTNSTGRWVAFSWAVDVKIWTYNC